MPHTGARARNGDLPMTIQRRVRLGATMCVLFVTLPFIAANRRKAVRWNTGGYGVLHESSRHRAFDADVRGLRKRLSTICVRTQRFEAQLRNTGVDTQALRRIPRMFIRYLTRSALNNNSAGVTDDVMRQHIEHVALLRQHLVVSEQPRFDVLLMDIKEWVHVVGWWHVYAALMIALTVL